MTPHQLVRRSPSAVVLAAVAAGVVACGSGAAAPTGGTSGTSSPPASAATLLPTASATSSATSSATHTTFAPALPGAVEPFTAFLLNPSVAAAAAVPFADTVRLGLGPTLYQRVPRGDLANQDRWRVTPPDNLFRASVGPFSALATARAFLDRPGATDPREAFTVAGGPHTNCFGNASPAPESLASADRISLTPAEGTIDSCIQWFSIDAFLVDGAIVAVTLDIGEP